MNFNQKIKISNNKSSTIQNILLNAKIKIIYLATSLCQIRYSYRNGKQN